MVFTFKGGKERKILSNIKFTKGTIVMLEGKIVVAFTQYTLLIPDTPTPSFLNELKMREVVIRLIAY